ncbi:hypothetical protein psyc5s11_32770 [Clostridium gelidum]|uniref:Uncharacterized protein n=1 Tax=Clostridium gelidum TaxID=704125 RepID=A0ABM7T7G0_9CLOT|nr:hypothetical protein [Clostridium gelidum]BCZ47210.1 hypothetical protein psyc5s11_32770 [Clostridium gelidum]
MKKTKRRIDILRFDDDYVIDSVAGEAREKERGDERENTKKWEVSEARC